MPNLSPVEILVIFVVVLLVFGPKRLPEIGRQIGKATRELRRMQASLQDEVREAFDPEPPTATALPPRVTIEPREGDHEIDAAPRGPEEGGSTGSDPPTV
jgi:sec-independent protein translocase protein TatA